MNLVITSSSSLVLLQFALLALSLLPSLIYGHAHPGNGRKHAAALAQLTGGAHLVMETQSGDVLVRAARGAGSAELTPTSVDNAATGHKRVKNNNKKSNKSSDHVQHAGGRKSGYKKQPGDGAQPQAHQQHHQQQQQTHQQGHKANKRQMLKQQQHQPGHHAHHQNASKRTGGQKAKQSENACRYEKGAWSECKAGQMTREDKLKVSDATNNNNEQSCEPIRITNRKCNPGSAGNKQGGNGGRSKDRKHKEKGSRRVTPQA
ncbi:homeobox protein 13 isoform X2 [Scaptodrosophila lebanonensis]|uniref:Homeobox protein 13 isoform X2 n=1 Tax=Drosophila lebanonensis TaxID=7225 RepID=A0A6J2UDC6_DROLE|nr:homeobox protein 13 isoform X2 [Scaptodrosophila lebanonensis]